MPIRTQFDFIEMVSLNGETGIRSYRSSDLKHIRPSENCLMDSRQVSYPV